MKTDGNNDNAETEASKESESLESYLAQNGMYNTDLLKVLKDENVSTKEDLRTKFKNPGDVTNICNAMRKRIETVVRNFCKNISSLTGIKNEYQEPVFPIAMKSPRALPAEKQTSNTNSNTKKNENNNKDKDKNKDKDENSNKKKAIRPKHTHAKTKAVTTTTKNKKKASTKSSSGKETPKKTSNESLKSPKKNKQRSKSRGGGGGSVTSPKKSNKSQADSIINAAAARKGSSVVGDYKKQSSRKNVSKTKDETKVEDLEASAKKGAQLKSWLQKNSCFHKGIKN